MENKNKTKTFNNLHQQKSGGKNIPLIWYSWKYKKENINHVLMLSFLLAAILDVIALVIWSCIDSKGFVKSLSGSLPWSSWGVGLVCLIFIFLIAAGSSWLSERKYRKIRMYDITSAKKTRF